MCKVLVIDNFDSFTFNLVHLLEGVGAEVTVVRNNVLNDVDVTTFENILISPGPGVPSDIPQVSEFVKRYYSSKNILGVCLGHQLIAEMLDSQLKLSDRVYHGIASKIKVDQSSRLFTGLPQSINVGRYHSWLVEHLNNKELNVTARDEEGNVMAFQHQSLPLFGIQFHPESILSEYGKEIITNWLK